MNNEHKPIVEGQEKDGGGSQEEAEIIAYIDGPFGAPAEQFRGYDHLIFVASGVGVTPFSSIMITLLYELKKTETKLPHKSVSFFWIQRQYNKTDYMNNIFKDIINEDKERIFDLNVYITGAQRKYDPR